MLCYNNNYDLADGPKWRQMAKRCFSTNIATFIFVLLFVFGALIRFAMSKEFVLPPLKWFTYIPIYWIIVGVSLSASHLDYANFLRQPHGLDYAEGNASMLLYSRRH